MNVFTAKKVNTDDLAKQVIKNIKHNIHVLGNDRDFLYHEMNSKVTNTIKETQADSFLNDIKNAYYFKSYDLVNMNIEDCTKYTNGKSFLKHYDIYTISDGLKLIKSILKRGYIALNNVLNNDIKYSANHNRNHIQLKNLSNYGGSEFSTMYSDVKDVVKDSHQKYIEIDSLGNTYEYNDINRLISMLSNLTNYFRDRLNFFNTKIGHKALLFCVAVNSIRQLPTKLCNKTLTKFLDKLFNSKDPQILNGTCYMIDTWSIKTTSAWIVSLKSDIKQEKNQQYDGYNGDLAIELTHLKQVENLAKQGFKYAYEETPSDDKMYAIDDSTSGVTTPFFEQLYDAIFDND